MLAGDDRDALLCACGVTDRRGALLTGSGLYGLYAPFGTLLDLLKDAFRVGDIDLLENCPDFSGDIDMDSKEVRLGSACCGDLDLLD